MKPLAILLLTSVFLAGSAAYAGEPSDTWNRAPTLSRVSVYIRDEAHADDVTSHANGYYMLREARYQTSTMALADISARCGSSLLQRRGDPPCTMFPDRELKPV